MNFISQNDIPEMSAEDVGQILSEAPKGIKGYSNYKLNKFSVNFRDVLSNTRKDITFIYEMEGGKKIFGESGEYEG